MMVIRGTEAPTTTPLVGQHTFVNVNGGRVWAPDSFLVTALGDNRIIGIDTALVIPTFEDFGTNAQLAFRNAVREHIHFDSANNLILDDDYSPLTPFRQGDRVIVASNQLLLAERVINYRIYPADRCTWRQTYEEGLGGYQIYDAQFFPGGGTVHDGLDIEEAQLGYIGKSGRFVEIAG